MMPDRRRRRGGIGTPDELRDHLRKFEDDGRRPGDLHPAGRQQPARAHLRVARAVRERRDAGVQGAREAEREKQKQEELAPYIEKAMARKQAMEPMRDEEIPVMVALGRQIAEEGAGTERQKQNAKLCADVPPRSPSAIPPATAARPPPTS